MAKQYVVHVGHRPRSVAPASAASLERASWRAIAARRRRPGRDRGGEASRRASDGSACGGGGGGGGGGGDDDDDDGDARGGGVADEGEGEGEWWSVRSMCDANDGAISVVGVGVGVGGGVVISRWLCRRWDTPRRRTVLGSSREPSRRGARGGDGGDDVG